MAHQTKTTMGYYDGDESTPTNPLGPVGPWRADIRRRLVDHFAEQHPEGIPRDTQRAIDKVVRAYKHSDYTSHGPLDAVYMELGSLHGTFT